MQKPRRILLLSPTHVGDIVIATSLLGVLKSAFPEAQLGFMTAAWANPVVRGHPLVSHTHILDHWRMSREKTSLLRKIVRYRTTRSRSMREIRSIKYDLALSINHGSIDLLNLAWRAGIPERVAFTASFWAPMATRLAEFPGEHPFRTQGECQAELLRKLNIEERHFANRRSTLASSTREAFAEVCRMLDVPDLDAVRYSVIHIGAGASFKEMPLSFWREAAIALAQQGPVLFTGRGSREGQNIESIVNDLPNCINACDRLSWPGFIAAIRRAQFLYGVDSMAAHVAAAVGTPSSTVSHGAAGVARWRPEGSLATVWTNPVSCSPCRRKGGCLEMTCLSHISPLSVIQAQVSERQPITASPN